MITNIKLALMKKDCHIEDDKYQYIIKSSATSDIKKIANHLNVPINESLIVKVSCQMYDDLICKTKDNVDSIGVWFTFDNNLIIENSISLSVFEDIKQYGDTNISPIKEFIKMTLNS